jgi:CheY-like chemotaxis protein
VATAATAADGLTAYRQASPDLVIIDLMMEEVDSGLTLAQQLKDLGNTAPVFFLSSTGDYLYGATDVADVGASGVFQKPINPAELLRLLGQKLGEPVRT